jgi:hypothetical protein
LKSALAKFCELDLHFELFRIEIAQGLSLVHRYFLCMEYDSERNPVLSASTLATLSAAAALFCSSDEEDAFVHSSDRRFGPQPFRERTQYQRKNYSMNQAAQMLIHNWHLDPNSRDHRDFRRFYRVPPEFFERFHEWFKEHNRSKPADCTGRVGVGYKLKTLYCFYMLAHAISALAASGIVGCDEETMRVFFLFFIRTVTIHLAPLHIRLPSTREQLAAAVATYAEESLPGCFGSIDCTHIGWTRARAAVRSWFVGKEGVPTVSFQVITDHNTKVGACVCVFIQSHGRALSRSCRFPMCSLEVTLTRQYPDWIPLSTLFGSILFSPIIRFSCSPNQEFTLTRPALTLSQTAGIR